MDPDKIKAIDEWPTPTTVKEVQQFHGLANYYRQYIHRFSAITKPLTELFRKGKEFLWTKREESAFQELKEKFR
ncbi:hypothetical protein [Lysobacter olei]